MQPSPPPSAADRLYLPHAMRDAILIHLLDAAPNEGVGLLAVAAPFTDEDDAIAVEAVRFIPGTNIEASSSRFTMDAAEVIAALREMREANQMLGAIVHSHLRGPATPSTTDLREAHYPDALLMIASFADQPAVLRAWRVTPENELRVVQPVELIVPHGT